MRIVVIGGSGLVGVQLVNNLRHRGHDVLAASPRSGVNTITGKGLAQGIAGSSVVVDVTNSPSFEDLDDWLSSRARMGTGSMVIPKSQHAGGERASSLY